MRVFTDPPDIYDERRKAHADTFARAKSERNEHGFLTLLMK